MRVGDLGKLLVERRQSGQQRQQRFRRSGLDYQPLTLLAHDGVFAGKRILGQVSRVNRERVTGLDEELAAARRGGGENQVHGFEHKLWSRDVKFTAAQKENAKRQFAILRRRHAYSRAFPRARPFCCSSVSGWSGSSRRNRGRWPAGCMWTASFMLKVSG